MMSCEGESNGKVGKLETHEYSVVIEHQVDVNQNKVRVYIILQLFDIKN